MCYQKALQWRLRRDLTDQVAIVTGGNTGIGLEVALGLAREHCTVIIIARDIGKCEKAAKYTKKHSGNEAVEYRQVTSGLSSIDRFDEMKAKFKKVNIPVNNAGEWAFIKERIDRQTLIPLANYLSKQFECCVSLQGANLLYDTNFFYEFACDPASGPCTVLRGLVYATISCLAESVGGKTA